MIDARKIVGDFFEDKVSEMFSLVRTDRDATNRVQDLKSKDDSFYMEVKASSCINGGVINKSQLYDFLNNPRVRFYAFCYHSIIKDMRRNFPTERKLRNVLDLKSLYLFPISIVKGYYEGSRKIKNPYHDHFVQLKEKAANAIYTGDEIMWTKLDLRSDEYKRAKPCENVYITTKEGYLEERLLKSFKV